MEVFTLFRVCLYMLKVPLILVIITVFFSVYQIICSLSMPRLSVNPYIHKTRIKTDLNTEDIKIAFDVMPISDSSIFPEISNISLFRNISQIGQIKTSYFYDMTYSNIFMYFQPIITHDERHFMLYTFEIFIRACQKANITYFLYGGTLMGAYRQHGMIPWDDDIDVMLNSSEKRKARTVLSKVPNFGLFSPHKRQWKFYHKSLRTLSHKPYRWPFIDIFFFAENDTHIWDTALSYRDEFVYKKSIIFPLQYRPFEKTLLPVPCNILKTLKTNYLVQVCSTTNFLHKLESGTPTRYKKRVSCKRLHEIYPFVFRHETYDSIIESILINGTLIKSAVLPKYC
ncbi:hypothetical protein LOTGIDRAFT_161254 [Lottia gigantea]|uniref:LicD/FKTN/FKRP nucleotidyltransferase domain-containing protein n=1 Tax=Lottia gigantea TaxID=225164 RepID=V3ZSY2_LOTGI|nr:hypothetical protein LOTGIDRAFT_161254 [Lottia gigantea]ESO94553.1 hypothetical protein LOTGIDRAFT_161254 [Lottia gigantea]